MTDRIRKRGTLALLLVTVCYLFIQWVNLEQHHNSILELGSFQPGRLKEVVFLLILCDASSGSKKPRGIAGDVGRQVQQAGVMLKSAAALTAWRLRFLVVADSENLYNDLEETIADWPEEYLSKVRLEYLPVWYPADRTSMRDMFRACATERLFVPAMLPHEDAVIYIDTDLIFMRPPEDLWAEFDKFHPQQLTAMAPCLYHYGTASTSKTPFYGSTGLNAGIMHMNLTRMNDFPEGGWLAANMRVFDQYKEDIVLADQDILNILFSEYPELLYELGCEWNYRAFQCNQGRNRCPVTSTRGAAIIHGNALSFVSGRENKIQAVYDSWQKHHLGSPLVQLYDTIRETLRQVSAEQLPSGCSSIRNIDVVLSQQLLDHLNRTGAV